MLISVNGKIVNDAESSVSPASDGLFYGAGCFESFASYSGRFLHLDDHLERLKKGVEFITNNKCEYIDDQSLKRDINNLLSELSLTGDRAKVRVQYYLADCHGYTLHDSLKMNCVITAGRVKAADSDLKLIRSETRVVPASCKPAHLKLSNMLHYRQAGIEAAKAGADDAVMLTTGGHVAETSIANIFWEKEYTVYTPSARCDILPGIMRQITIDLLRQMGYSVEEGEYVTEELMNASQIWTTNSVRELRWVRTVDSTSFSTSTDLRSRLMNEFENYKKRHLH